MNEALLRQVMDEIRKEPKQFDITSWFDRQASESPCGTTGCIAGWAVALVHHKGDLKAASQNPILYPGKVGQKLLELSYEEKQRLFFLEHWPKAYRDAYWANGATAQCRARATVARIEHFIATEGKE